ncbi:hypothetical protein [Hydrogenophaga sp. RWCD_12]|uniref:hypothetical protein n=1 Tax=Hydrogenophaga sp. RWCD_12 TaxID=3391190 RepID=UPI0039846EC3
MTHKKRSHSLGWRDAIFGSAPRRCVATQSKSTTRLPILTPSGWQYAEGGHEATALLLLSYLQRFGVVKRFKAQPFSLEEIGGPEDRIPDVLVELATGESTLHVIQVKSQRFITEEVKERFDIESAFLEQVGIGYHVWTDRGHLSSNTSHTVRMLDRGFRHPASRERIEQVRGFAASQTTLAPLLSEFGWDDAISAASYGAFHINVTEKIHENTPICHCFPSEKYLHLFGGRHAALDWWESVAH